MSWRNFTKYKNTWCIVNFKEYCTLVCNAHCASFKHAYLCKCMSLISVSMHTCMFARIHVCINYSLSWSLTKHKTFKAVYAKKKFWLCNVIETSKYWNQEIFYIVYHWPSGTLFHSYKSRGQIPCQIIPFWVKSFLNLRRLNHKLGILF